MNPLSPPHGTSSPIGNVDNFMQNSSTTMSWEVLCDDNHLYPNIELLRQLEQSMEFGNLNDDDNDDWSQPDENNNIENDDRRMHPKNHTSASVAQQVPEIISSVQTIWKVRCFYLIRINVVLVVTTMMISVLVHVTPDDRNQLSLLPVILNVVQILCMVLFVCTFRIYNFHVQQTKDDILQKSTKALQFVEQMFPENLREQLFNHNSTTAHNHASTLGTSNHPLHTALVTNTDKVIDHYNISNTDSPMDIENGETGRTSSTIQKSTHSDTVTTVTTIDTNNDSKNANSNGFTCSSGLVLHSGYTPIAELYPETTVMLADLAGFTAWSAVHEPSEVFILLETIFYEFDVLASKRNIFKVETVGDCYVAVAGVPEPRSDHGVVMARFARECMMRFQAIVQQLEVRFGPGTSELGMRIGLNSGPITGGILRGERSRFQLFGDTINTAARMESNSCKGRIQVSETTAQLLFKANKHHWLIKRDDEIEAKGKGTLQTYWLDINANHGSMVGSAFGGGGAAAGATGDNNNSNKPVPTEESLEDA